MLHVTTSELTRAFKDHRAFVHHQNRPRSRSANLLLAYAIECGVKALLLYRNELTSTKELEKADAPSKIKDLKIGHDINKGLGILGAPETLPKEMKHRTSGQSIEPNEYHQAWRYGVNFDETEEQATEALLLEIAKWISTRIREEMEAS